jgi:hypothetical protein
MATLGQSAQHSGRPPTRPRGLSRGERITLLVLSLYGLLALGYALAGTGFLEAALTVALLLAGGLRITQHIQRRERARTRTARRPARTRAYQSYQTLGWH